MAVVYQNFSLQCFAKGIRWSYTCLLYTSGGLGSDAAIEAADVVLMTDEPSKLVDAIDVAKATKQIVMQNIVIALGIKSVFLILGALGIAGMWRCV